MALAEISAGLDDFEQVYADRLKRFQSESAETIAKWVAAGLDPADLTDTKTLAQFPGRLQLQADLVELLGGMAQFGSDQIETELARQAQNTVKS